MFREVKPWIKQAFEIDETIGPNYAPVDLKELETLLKLIKDETFLFTVVYTTD